MNIFKGIVNKAAQSIFENTGSGKKPSKSELLCDEFKLPSGEEIVDECQADVSVTTKFRRARLEALETQTQGSYQNPHYIESDSLFSGKLFLTNNFLVFRNNYDPMAFSFTLDLMTIKKIERVQMSYDFTVSIHTSNGLEITVQFIGLRSHCENFGRNLTIVLKKHLLSRPKFNTFLMGLYSEYLLYKNHSSDFPVEVPPANGLGWVFKFPGNPQKLNDRLKMKKWFDLFRENGRNLAIVKTIPFYKLVSFGLPNKLRGEMWETCCGSIYLRLHNDEEYNKILVDHDGETSLALEEIEKDLNRSLPEYPAYQNEEGINRLRRVLTAYSWKDPDIGYCQAMNIVTAALLIYMSEEQVFWCLNVLCHKIIPGYYSKTMYGVLLDQKVFEELVKKSLPLLSEHFQRLDIPLSIVSLPWFLSFFLNTMPLIYSLRVVDMLLLHGPRVLFQVSLAVLRVNGEDLLNCEDDGECINVFKDFFQTLDDEQPSFFQEGKMRTKFDNLWDVAFREFSVIDDKIIGQYREKNKNEIFQGIETFVKRTEIRNLPKTPHINSTQLSNLYDRYYSILTAENKGAPMQNSASFTFQQFTTFMSKLVDWVNLNGGNNEEKKKEGDLFLHRLYDNWSVDGIMTLETLCVGLDKLLDKDIMNSLSNFFNLYDPNKKGKIGRETILQIAEDLLYVTAPWRDGYLFDEITNKAIEIEIAKKIVERRKALEEQGIDFSREDEIRLPSEVKFNDSKWKNKQSERYLASSSNFLKLVFQYAQPEEDPEEPLISLSDDEADNDSGSSSMAIKKKTEKFNKALDPSHPMYITPSMFRMVILADETYESFFSNTLYKSIHVDDEVSVEFGMINNIRGMFNNFLADGRRVAVEVSRRMDAAAKTIGDTASSSSTAPSINNNHNSANGNGNSDNDAMMVTPVKSRAHTLTSANDDDDDFGNFITSTTSNDDGDGGDDDDDNVNGGSNGHGGNLNDLDVNLTVPNANEDLSVLHDLKSLKEEYQLAKDMQNHSLI